LTVIMPHGLARDCISARYAAGSSGQSSAVATGPTSLTANRQSTSTACPSRSTTAPVTSPSATRSERTVEDSHTSPPCSATTSASAAIAPIVPSGAKPNFLNALRRVK
jgi:hypothetical protein